MKTREERLAIYREVAAGQMLKGFEIDDIIRDRSKVLQLEDELVINFINPTDDVQADIAKLVAWEIQNHDDPAVSELARARQYELATLKARVAELEDQLEYYDRQEDCQ